MDTLSSSNDNSKSGGQQDAPLARTLIYATGLTILMAGELAMMLEFSVWAAAHLMHLPHFITLVAMVIVLGLCAVGAVSMFTHTWRIEKRLAAGLDPLGASWNPLKH